MKNLVHVPVIRAFSLALFLLAAFAQNTRAGDIYVVPETGEAIALPPAPKGKGWTRITSFREFTTSPCIGAMTTIRCALDTYFAGRLLGNKYLLHLAFDRVSRDLSYYEPDAADSSEIVTVRNEYRRTLGWFSNLHLIDYRILEIAPFKPFDYVSKFGGTYDDMEAYGFFETYLDPRNIPWNAMVVAVQWHTCSLERAGKPFYCEEKKVAYALLALKRGTWTLYQIETPEYRWFSYSKQ